MRSFTRALAVSALLAMVNGQAVLLSAKGDSGESLALQLKADDPKDANIINDAELNTNIVNECGRTLLNGNIDIGQNTEDAIAAGKVTKVSKGSKVVATLRQVNAQGAGPFTCDMDQTSNSLATGQTKLKVQESPAQGGNIKLTITMPADMKLTGASTGDIGTVRCRNAQNFGSCFAVQQTDTTPAKNTPDNVKTAQTLDNILTQVAQDKKDLPAVAKAISEAKTESEQGTGVVDALLKNNPQIKQANGTANAGAGAGAANGKGKGKGKGGNGKGNARAGKANGAGNAAAKKNKNKGKAKAGKANGAGNAAAKKNKNNAAAAKKNN